MKRPGYLIALGFGLLLTCCTQALAQQLDRDYFPKPTKTLPMPAQSFPAASGTPMPEATPLPPMNTGKPLSISITKTLYLPPAMYGQWSITGTLQSTNMDDVPPVTTDIWVLERQGDAVIITNPANGATAAISVKEAEGDHATIQRQLSAPRNYVAEELLYLTVKGDTLTGQDIRKMRAFKNGRMVKEHFTVYRIDATRIGGARTQFRPENTLNGPDIQIEEKL